MAPALAIDEAGWVRGMRHVASENHSPRPPATAPSLLVVHGISLPPGQFGGEAVLQLFTNALDCQAHPYYQRLRGLRVSAHFFIRRDGETIQLVSTEQCAWHAGQSVWRGKTRCNDFSIGVELEGHDDVAYDKKQYPALAALITLLRQRYPQLLVAGHADIAAPRKTDPGAGFNWQTLLNLIGNDCDGRSPA